MASAMIDRLGSVGCKTALRLAERAVAATAASDVEIGANYINQTDLGRRQVTALLQILDDLAGDESTAQNLCEVIS